MKTLLLLLLLVQACRSHDYYGGNCPNFPPMEEFHWDRFSSSVWYVSGKTGTSSSCLTYQFYTDSQGFRSVRQTRKLGIADVVGLNHEYIYTGKLSTPEEWSLPAKMVVKFPLN